MANDPLSRDLERLQPKDMTGWEIREELRESAKPRLAQENKNRDAFLRALAPKGYPRIKSNNDEDIIRR